MKVWTQKSSFLFESQKSRMYLCKKVNKFMSALCGYKDWWKGKILKNEFRGNCLVKDYKKYH